MSVRAACDLLAEVASTRIAAIENYAHAQVAIQVRRLEQRLIEATSTEGDWRLALFRNPRTLLQPLEATGAALFQEGEILTTGEVPSTPELRALLPVGRPAGRRPVQLRVGGQAPTRRWIHSPHRQRRAGGQAVGATRPDYLMWFRKEQLLTVTWAGDPNKPMVGNDPLELSPRARSRPGPRSCAARRCPGPARNCAGTRLRRWRWWTSSCRCMPVRLLIAEHQLDEMPHCSPMQGSCGRCSTHWRAGQTLFLPR
jgi:chemotaxis family two-component system sensor kinase Cph1